MSMRNLVLAASLLTLLGCGDRQEELDSWAGFAGPYQVDNELVYLDRNFNELVVLTPKVSATALDWSRTPVAEDSSVVGVLRQEKALVLRSNTANLFQVYYPASGKIVEFETESPYDRFVLKQDPPIVAAHFSANAQDTDSLFVNKSEVLFLDIKKEVKPQPFNVPTYGGAPLGVDIADRVPTADGGRVFAFVRWNSYISMVDAEDPAFVPVSIPLKTQDSDVTVVPDEMQFVAGDGLLQAFFVGKSTADLYAVTVVVDQLGPEGAGVSLNVFSTAAGAWRFDKFTNDDGELQVLVLSPGAKTVGVVNPTTSQVALYKLDIAPRNLELFQLDRGEGPENLALIYDDTGQSKAYYFVELDRLAEKKSKAFNKISLLAPASRVYMLDGDHFLVMHPAGNSDPLSRVSLADGSVSSLGGNLVISDEVFAANGKTMYALAVKGGTTYVVALDPATLQFRQLELPGIGTGSGLTLMTEQGVLAVHHDNGESLYVLPEDFDGQDDAVEFLVPVLNGLEH